MIELTEQQLTGATKAVLFANTPMYIFKALRSDATVLWVANKYSWEEIAQSFAEAKTRDCFESVVIMYVFLVSLFHKSREQALAGLEKIDASGQTWMEYIKEVICEKRTQQQVIRMDIGAQSISSGYKVQVHPNVSSIILTELTEA